MKNGISHEPSLLRAIGPFSLTAIALNGVIGSGIFVLPATVAGLLGPASPLAYLVAAALVGLIAACFAEAGSMFEKTGGPYLYAHEAFGGFVGFQVGWMFLLSRLTASAAIGNAFASYLGYFWPSLTSGAGRAVTLSVLFFSVAWINFLGVRPGSRVVNLFTLAKLLPLVLFVGAGLFFVDWGRLHPGPGIELSRLQQASLALVFAFGGFENATIPTEESRDPRRNVPRALMTSIVLTTVLYILIQIVALGTLPDLATAATPLASAGAIFLGPAGGLLITLGAVLSTAGSNSALALVGPRIVFAMSAGGRFPAAFSRIHPRRRTPHAAIMLFAISGWLLSVAGTFAQLVAASAMARLMFSASTCLAVPVLRRKLPEASRRFTLPGGFSIPVLAALVSLWLLSGIDRSQAAAGGLALLAGTVLYLIPAGPGTAGDPVH
jgi:amino acid transporter